MTLPWSIARFLPWRVLRLYWLCRLRWRCRQLTKMQRRVGAILLANHARFSAAVDRQDPP